MPYKMTSLLMLFFSIFAMAADYKQQSFSSAKRMSIQINKDAPGSFYCGCTIHWQNKKGFADLNSCGYLPRKNPQRATKIEWDHIVPAWEFGHQLQCWQQGGRKNCCHDPYYRLMEADLHNLQPVLREINNDRANFRFSQWQTIKTPDSPYGACDMFIDFKARRSQPPARTRGAIARDWLYMHDRYHLQLSSQQMRLFNVWDRQYPVTEWECLRNKRITQIQGNSNLRVAKHCHNHLY